MSSPTTTTTANAATTNAAVERRQTYWCHECDMSVSLLIPSTTTTTTPLTCPDCHGDFLEEMDPNPNPNPNHNHPTLSPFPFSPISLPQTLPTTTTTAAVDLSDIGIDFSDTTTFPFPSATTSDDNYLLDSPYLQRLVQHLANSESDDDATDATTTTAAVARCHSPASKSAVESIPTVVITPSLLELDPIILCAVCKDQFVIDIEAKQLPCKHIYHSECILPWLESHNSCPVCRFQLPIEVVRKERRRRSRFGELMEDEGEGEDSFGFGNTLRHIARRHGLVFPVSQQSRLESFLLSHTRRGEAEPLSVERADTVETVSSWPNWPVEGAIALSGGGDGDIGVSSRVNDDGDNVMANARVSGSVSTNLREMSEHRSTPPPLQREGRRRRRMLHISGNAL